MKKIIPLESHILFPRYQVGKKIFVIDLTVKAIYKLVTVFSNEKRYEKYFMRSKSLDEIVTDFEKNKNYWRELEW